MFYLQESQPASRRYIQEDRTLRNRRSKNLKSYRYTKYWSHNLKAINNLGPLVRDGDNIKGDRSEIAS
jgi:hypothetical protein